MFVKIYVFSFWNGESFRKIRGDSEEICILIGYRKYLHYLVSKHFAIGYAPEIFFLPKGSEIVFFVGFWERAVFPALHSMETVVDSCGASEGFDHRGFQGLIFLLRFVFDCVPDIAFGAGLVAVKGGEGFYGSWNVTALHPPERTTKECGAHVLWVEFECEPENFHVRASSKRVCRGQVAELSLPF